MLVNLRERTEQDIGFKAAFWKTKKAEKAAEINQTES
jgi:hypothetical protein